MTDIPNRALGPEELKQFEFDSQLQRAVSDIEYEFAKRAEDPSKLAGQLLAVLAVSMFLDISAWPTAMLSGIFYYIFATFLTTIETVCIVGLAGLAIHGSIEIYKQKKAIEILKENFQTDEGARPC